LPTALCFWISKMPSKLRKNTMPRRFAPRLFLTISQKVKIGGLFTKKFELYFKGNAASASTRLPRHLYRSAFGLAYFLRARFFLFATAKSLIQIINQP